MRNFFLPLCAIFFSGLLASVPGVGLAGEVPRVGFATASLEATRFVDSDVSTVSVAAGSEVEVLAEVREQGPDSLPDVVWLGRRERHHQRAAGRGRQRPTGPEGAPSFR